MFYSTCCDSVCEVMSDDIEKYDYLICSKCKNRCGFKNLPLSACCSMPVKIVGWKSKWYICRKCELPCSIYSQRCKPYLEHFRHYCFQCRSSIVRFTEARGSFIIKLFEEWFCPSIKCDAGLVWMEEIK